MVSSPALVNTNSSKLFWRHDESSSDNNNFYGLQADSVIGVSFNDNPSANKQFKSFSIESSDPENISGLNTFQVNKGGTNYIPKETEIGVVKQKGGIIYGHIGEDKKITASNISIMGVVKSIQGLFDDTEDLPLEEAEELYSNAGNSAGYKYIKELERFYELFVDYRNFTSKDIRDKEMKILILKWENRKLRRKIDVNR